MWEFCSWVTGGLILDHFIKQSQGLLWLHPPTKNPRLIHQRLITSKPSWSSFMGGKFLKRNSVSPKLQKTKIIAVSFSLPVSCNPRACEGAANTHSAVMAWFQQCHSSWVVNVNLILLLYSCDFKTVLKTQNMSPTIHTSSWMCTFMWSVGREKPFFFHLCVLYRCAQSFLSSTEELLCLSDFLGFF